ncbi:hypothetical protein [Aureivirga marina]|uniref:hypothetical protein n=1 Tax=Aureivirga marina TaxID=1182451 RepID=UPI0018C93EE6|nr:hypothetical protein [Aureivirga marina]
MSIPETAYIKFYENSNELVKLGFEKIEVTEISITYKSTDNLILKIEENGFDTPLVSLINQNLDSIVYLNRNLEYYINSKVPVCRKYLDLYPKYDFKYEYDLLKTYYQEISTIIQSPDDFLHWEKNSNLIAFFNELSIDLENIKFKKEQKNIQDKNSVAWKKLCEYVEIIHKNEDKIFRPIDYLGDLYFEIHTLPKSISKLDKVEEVILYGSQIKRIPPEISEMKSLKEFTPYTSYFLHWFPYEITKCKNLTSSTISTRALFGNYKNRLTFPDLYDNPVRYDENDSVKCSICEKDMTHAETDQYWITLKIATDTVPLLANICSEKCKEELPSPAKGYVQNPHKGGKNLKQPTYEEWEKENMKKATKIVNGVEVEIENTWIIEL